MIEKYLEICDLLNQIGPLKPRLDLIQKMIQSPDFKYQKESFPGVLTDILAQSAYWLHMDLFEERYLYQKNFENLPVIQQDHLQLLDIGVALLEKGFPLKYNAEKYGGTGISELTPYAKKFIEQCHKRYDFLHGKKEKIRPIPVNQRTRD